MYTHHLPQAKLMKSPKITIQIEVSVLAKEHMKGTSIKLSICVCQPLLQLINSYRYFMRFH